jgi:hypothetical protein
MNIKNNKCARVKNLGRVYDLVADPGEHHDLAAQFLAVVAGLARKHDAWFDDVFAEWIHSRERIVADDSAAWQGRAAPDPATLFAEFWQWNSAPPGTDPKAADPLKVFPGYWRLKSRQR